MRSRGNWPGSSGCCGRVPRRGAGRCGTRARGCRSAARSKGRADVVSALEDVGLAVPRQGKDYITARDPDSDKR